MNCPPRSVKTTCPYCGVGCGVIADVATDGQVSVKGDLEHPANWGRLCSKGSALAETLSLDGRLLEPRIDGRSVSWKTALDTVSTSLQDVIRDYGPDAVAFYVSGQLLTEDYYAVNKLAKGFIGTANIDTNSRLCMASSVAGHRRAFGSDTVPGTYEDLEEADLIVLVGSNFAWCHPVLYQRMEAARTENKSRLVVVDPRKTASCETADLHLPINPGTDVALFTALLKYLSECGAVNADYVSEYTQGFEAALSAAGNASIAETGLLTGIDIDLLRTFFGLFAKTERVVTVFSQGVNQSTSGTDKVNAIINCHLATGRIGRPGMGPFSITGQPNAMGGREVGGLANQLAAHMSLEDAKHRDIVSRFWGVKSVPDKAGLKAVDLFKAVKSGEIKAVWIMATNPAASVPEADEVAAALKACPLVIVSDVTDTTRTAKLADILLPAQGWGEKDGTVTNSERRISRQRAVIDAAGEAKPDWWIISEVAKRMGYSGFEYNAPNDIFQEHAVLSAFENSGTRDFDIGGLADLTEVSYDELTPVQWPIAEGQSTGTKRFFEEGGFFTPSGKAQFVPLAYRPPASECSQAHPFVLNTGRVRDHWHTMTRTGKSARLSSHIAEPFLEIHPDDAKICGVDSAGLAHIESTHGSIIVRVLVTSRVKRGNVFVPMHWTDPYASCAHVDALVGGNTDPVSGQPELKYTPVVVRPFEAKRLGFLVSHKEPNLSDLPYWAIAPIEGGWRAEFALGEEVASIDTLFSSIVGDHGEIASYTDDRIGAQRMVSISNGVLDAALYLSREPVEVGRSWLVGQLGKELDGATRIALLAGRPGADKPDAGPIVCSCYQVGANEIARAAEAGAHDVDAIGDVLKAGTNCGSCRSEIGQIVRRCKLKEVG